MIHRVEKLVSIGKFRDFQASGNISFKKMTMVYAENGSGKTTLATVFRSLTQNNPTYIKKRNSTNATIPQSAQIIEIDSSGERIYHTFGRRGWSEPLSDIEIFDTYFINDNIYSGFEFSEEQKKHLHQFVIGEQGVKLKDQILKNKTKRSELKQDINSLENEIIEKVGNGLNKETLQDFLEISRDRLEEIDEKVAIAEKELNKAKSNLIIEKLELLDEIPTKINNIEYELISSDLKTTLDVIHDQTLKTIFEDHCMDLSENSIENPELWLKTGYNYVTNKFLEGQNLCPFCKQGIHNLDIIKAYSLRFNEKFNSFTSRLQTHIKNLKDINMDVLKEQINKTTSINNRRVSSWTEYLPDNISLPSTNISNENIDLLSNKIELLIETIEEKHRNLSITLPTNIVEELKYVVNYIENCILEYNYKVKEFNETVKTLRNELLKVEIAEEKLNNLLRVKKRYEDVVNNMCEKLLQFNEDYKKLQKDYRNLVQKQEEEAHKFLSKYQEQINYYLIDVFKTPFKIENIEHVRPRGRATHSKLGYTLTIDGCEISFDPEQYFSTRDCLSEGDKSTIALAFFMAKIDVIENIEDKIIVIDDPLSSFDRNRRSYTVKIIKELFFKAKQVIVLSHNEIFLYHLSKNLRNNEQKILRISQDFNNNASYIEELNIETLVENDYFKHVKELETFLTNPELEKKERILGLIRNVLEAHIRFKFYRQTRDIQGTFGKLIRMLKERNISFRDSNTESVINDLSILNNISLMPHHGDPTPGITSEVTKAKELTLTELVNLVKDTLQLIDERL